MAYQILKPEIKSVHKAVWDTVKVSQLFWGILVFALVLWVLFTSKILGETLSSIFEGSFYPFFIFTVVIYFISIEKRIESSFWEQVAGANGWQYRKNYGDINHRESGVMFRQGDKKYISNIIEGNIDNRSFRTFNYGFTISSGKNETGYDYTVFVFKFDGSFPHIYLNNKHNRYAVSAGEKIPLPAEFEKNFSLSAPKEYEIEALEIFTPDILARLLDGGFAYDVEFVDKEMLIFTEGRINKAEELIRKFNQALELEDLFDEKLDKFSFQPIGDMPSSL